MEVNVSSSGSKTLVNGNRGYLLAGSNYNSGVARVPVNSRIEPLAATGSKIAAMSRGRYRLIGELNLHFPIPFILMLRSRLQDFTALNGELSVAMTRLYPVRTQWTGQSAI